MITDPKWGSKLRRDTDSAGNTPLHVAAKHGSLAAIKLLLEGDSVTSKMCLAWLLVTSKKFDKMLYSSNVNSV